MARIMRWGVYRFSPRVGAEDDTMRILAVDDDQSTRRIVGKLLSGRGYEVDTASDGIAALDLICQSNYDLAVLDYDMPAMNGVELFQRMTDLRPGTIAVFLTGHAGFDSVFPALEPRIKYVLPKPIEARTLLGVVERLLGPPTERGNAASNVSLR
ncbi:MAG: response regulator [Planctomycetes bacterium]|nr:response regulator [Planctomycetota bacterium]